MEPKIINDLDEYKNLVYGWVHGVELGMRWCEKNTPANIRHIQELAEKNFFDPPFVFQDEDASHFNHDVAMECEKRLTECQDVL